MKAFSACRIQIRFTWVSITSKAACGSAGCFYLAQEEEMLETIAVVLILLWLLGLVSSYTLGGFIHILLVVAVILVLLRLVRGRGI
jgi:hypothetical protein